MSNKTDHFIKCSMDNCNKRMDPAFPAKGWHRVEFKKDNKLTGDTRTFCFKHSKDFRAFMNGENKQVKYTSGGILSDERIWFSGPR